MLADGRRRIRADRLTSSRDDPGVIFDRYLEVLHEPFFVEGNRIEVRATIGYSSAPEDSTDADGLVMLADLALYEAKSTGRNRVGKFSPLLGEGIGAGDCAPRAGQRDRGRAVRSPLSASGRHSDR